jgi:hypothetical protein
MRDFIVMQGFMFVAKTMALGLAPRDLIKILSDTIPKVLAKLCFQLTHKTCSQGVL